jgi:hypothetical protein
VVVTGSVTAPQVLDRFRIELLDGSLPAHPYHAAAEAGMSVRSARSLIGNVETLAAKSASASLVPLVVTVEQGGPAVAGIAVVTTERNIPDELERVLRSHQLLHAAEGDLYEDAIDCTRRDGRARDAHPLVTRGLERVRRQLVAEQHLAPDSCQPRPLDMGDHRARPVSPPQRAVLVARCRRRPENDAGAVSWEVEGRLSSLFDRPDERSV